MIKDYRNLRTSVASLAPLVLLAALLFVQAPAWGQSEEPTRPAQCANATTTQDDWIDSVTATSSTITVTLADPIPRAGKIAISACRSGTSAWVLSDITPAAGDQFTIDYVANNNSGPDTLKIQPDTDYWVRVQAWNYSGNNSVYHHIRTTAETTFVSNTGVTSDGTERAGFATAGDTTHSRLAQTFTTGSATNGYALAKVDVALGANSGDRDEKNTLRVRIFSVSSSGDPDSALHTLTQPSSLSDSAVNTYSALGNATLDANTDYAVVLDGTSTDHSIEIARVTSDDEDSGAAAGWGIADGQRTSTDLSSWTLLSHSLQIAVKGSEIPSSSGSTTPTITIAPGTSPVTEGTAAEFTVTASEAPSADLVVNLNVSESSDGDYVADGNEGSKTVTITATNTSATYSVATEADTTNEPNGTVTVAVASGTGYTVGTASSADVTVNDDDDATITDVEITSSPAFGDTYRRGETIEVKVTWSEDVTWDVSATNASLQVDLAIGSVNRGARLVTGGATSGTARSLAFRYAVVQADTDTDGVAVTPLVTQIGSFLVTTVNGATLKDSTAAGAGREHAGLSADAGHKVDGSVVNATPAFASTTVTREVAENTAGGGNVGAAVTATDANSDTLTYTLGGTDASSFGLDGSSGQITVGTSTNLNFEGTQTSYSVTVTASDGVEDATADVTINVTDVAEAPSAPSAPTVNATSGSNTSLDVSWSAPTDAGRPAVTDYDWRWKVQTDTTWTEKTDTTTTATSAVIASLTAGTAYHVQVRATNDEGTSGWSSSGSGTTNSATNNAPTVANAIPDQAAMVGTAFSYAFPANTFNDTDNDTLTYTATQSDGSALPGWLGFTDSTRTFAGTPADAGTVSVTVTASDGTASVSDGFAILVTPANTAPVFASTSVTREVAENTAAGGRVGGPVTATDANAGDTLVYALRGTDAPSFAINPSTGQITVGASTALNFEAKSSYSVTVTASDGTEEATATVTINVTDVTEAPSAPGAPTVGAASGTTTSLNVRWSAPTNTGPAITDYDWRWKVQTETAWTEKTDTTTSVTSATITGLAVNTAYHVQVRATNDEGTSGWSSSGSGTTNSATNNAPTVANEIADQTATAGTAFSYAFPTNTFNDADGHTLSYTATQSDGAALPAWLSFDGATRTFSGTPAAADAGTVSVQVTADDSNGGTVSDIFDIVVGVGRPGVPVVKIWRVGEDETIQSFRYGQALDRAIRLTWDPPASGPAPTGYRVRWWKTGDYAGTVSQTDVAAETGQQNYTILGLTNEVEYGYSVTALNGDGESQFPGGTASARVPVATLPYTGDNAVLFAQVPTVGEGYFANRVPQSIQVSAATAGQLVVQWDAPINTANVIVRYEIAWTSSTSFVGASPTTVAANLRSHTITGLTGGQDYRVRITTVYKMSGGSEGEDTAPAFVSATALSAPSAVTDLHVTADNGELHLRWSPPTSDGGLPLARYEVRWGEDGGTPGSVEDAGLHETYTVTGLTNGQAYQAEVRAVNSGPDPNPGGAGATRSFEGPFATATGTPFRTPSPKLVSNTGQTDGGDGGLSNDHAQRFTTGRHPSGYKLTSAALELHLASGTAPTYAVSVRSSNASGQPDETTGGEIGTLTQEGSLTGSAASLQFAAEGDGLDLAPDTHYWLLFDVTAGASSTAHVGRTTGKAQDSGGAVGWRIGNSRLARPAANTTWPDAVSTNVLKLAVHGHPQPLVRNTGQTKELDGGFTPGESYADGFTTGSYGAGYRLTGVDLRMTVGAGASEPDYRVSIWSSGSDGNPDSSLGTLTNPASLRTGLNRFTASGAGIELAGETTYYVVLDSTSRGDRSPQVAYTTGDGQRGAAGWTIANDALRFDSTSDTWISAGVSTMFAVHGHRIPPLVSNTGRDDSGNATLNNDHAQAFTTGSHAHGYKLTAVELKLASTAATAPTYTLKVRSSNGSNEPDENDSGEIGELTQQGNLASDGAFLQFTAPGDGLDLAANTDYFVLLDVTADASANALVRRTASNDEDPGAAAGWAINNGRLYRSSTGTAWTSHTADVLKLAVIGEAQSNSAPEASRTIADATLDVGDTLEVDLSAHFSDPDNDTLAYAGESSDTAVATVSVAGAMLTVSGVAAGTATVTVTASDPGGQSATQTLAVTVTEPPPSTPPFGGGGPSDGGGTEPRNAAPEASAAIGALTLGAGGAVGLDLSERFSDPDGDSLDFAAESSNPAIAAVEVDGAALTVRGLVPGSAEVTVTATDPDGESAAQAFTVTVTGVETVWHLPPASDPVLQGFVRVINHSDHAGTATVTATDDAGQVYEPLTLALGRRGAAHFNVHDLEMGNPAKGLTGATGPGTGGWRLAVWSDSLAVEALAYARAADGFLTPLDGTAPRTADGALALATFNPGSNWRQVSLLRLVNPTEDDAEAAVAGTDDAGSSPSAPVRLTIPAGTACTVDAAELESGRGLACGEPQAGLGDGEGKWRLRIESEAPLVAQGLLRSPTGHLSNLSGGALPADAGGVRRVHLFPSASDPDGRQGFVRFINRSDRDGTVTVRAADGTDADYEALTLALKANEAVQFNSDDLELGNPDKGLTGSTGPGRGDWTLALSAEGIEFDAFAYVRSRRDGFLAPMGASAPSRDADGGSLGRVAFLNPGSNWRQRSLLRLVNPGAADAQASIEGTDDTGLRPGAPVRLTVPAGGAVALASPELESGDAQAIESGALGDGKGKWRLRIASDTPIAAQSLATSPTGRLVNLSGADATRGFRHGLLPPPGRVTLESPYECELLGRWDAAPGAPHAVDLLRDGERLAALSAARWTQPTRRWAGLCGGGSYTIRVCALNADGDCGPWSAESNAVTVD